MQKKYLVPFNEIRRSKKQLIPVPFSKNNQHKKKDCIITLVLPHHDIHTHLTFSAGTRFVAKKAKEQGYLKIYIFDRTIHTFTTSLVPEEICCLNGARRNNGEKLDEFVALLRMWVNNTCGSVPFCWGGCSLTKFYTHIGYQLLKKTDTKGNQLRYWRLDNDTMHPCSGFDMSGLVLRAAQICEIPYYCKNSTAAAKLLRAANAYDLIENGDILWVPGGLFVISDIQRGLLITMGGYQHGYGKLVELPINDLFDNLTSINDLRNALTNRVPLELKDARGTLYRTITDFKILKMRSCWTAQ
jgi:hypothetical protein